VCLVRIDVLEAIRSSDTSAPTRAKRHHIPDNDIFHNHRRENLRSYIIWTRSDAKIRNKVNNIFKDRQQCLNVLDVELLRAVDCDNVH
jgi:hypothetical protein